MSQIPNYPHHLLIGAFGRGDTSLRPGKVFVRDVHDLAGDVVPSQPIYIVRPSTYEEWKEQHFKQTVDNATTRAHFALITCHQSEYEFWAVSTD